MSSPPAGGASGGPGPNWYPDPSIPGYIRYWNGTAWVPGSSRPEPREGEPAPTPPAGSGVAPAAPTPAQAPPKDETQPFFFDEDPTPADSGPQVAHSGDQRVAWGSDEDVSPSPATAAGRVDPRGQFRRTPAEGAPAPEPAPSPAPEPPPAQAPEPSAPRADAGGGSWERQVHELAQGGGQGPDAAAAGPPVQAAQAPSVPSQSGPPGLGAPPAPSPQQGVPVPGQASPATPQAGPPQSSPPQGVPTPGGPTGLGVPPQPGPAQGAQPAQPLPPAQPVPPQAGPAPVPPASPAQGVAVPPTRPSPGQGVPVPGAAAGGYGYPQQQPQQPGAPGGYGYPQQPGAAAGGYGYPQAQPQPQPQQPGSAGGGYGYPQAGSTPPGQSPYLQAHQGDPLTMIRQFVDPEQKYPAGLGRRLLARIVDSLLPVGAAVAVALPLVGQARDHIQEQIDAAERAGITKQIWLIDGTTGGYLALVLGVFLVVGLLFEALPTAIWGTTLGKGMVGARVVDVERQEKPSFGAALLRWLLYNVLALLVVGIVSLVLGARDRPWRQAWHDKAAHTFVAVTKPNG
ncbi:RDD family protein [Streptomyces sp. NPDC127098]|uniref:RDD family protein n=1 Tax=Streptomyces sp. NPDC127098 TaxID=3347137 RepID=UPI003648E254